MSFLKGMFSLTLHSSIPEDGWSAAERVQVAVHPAENEEYLLARLLAYAHCSPFRPNFSEGLFNPKDPTILSSDAVGNTTLWCEVGVPPIKKAKKARSIHPAPELRIYFYDRSQIDQFCHLLRGSKENWIKSFSFFLIGSSLIRSIAQQEWATIDNWDVVFIEDTIYLELNGVTHQGELERLDMWSQFQIHLKNQELYGGGASAALESVSESESPVQS